MTVLTSGGCVRLYPANHATPGPQWHINSGHSTVGLFDTRTPPTIDDKGFLVVKLIPIPGRSVIYMNAASDETLTRNGIRGGCSNGGEILRIGVAKEGFGEMDLGVPDEWAMVAGIYNNFWLTADHLIPAALSVGEIEAILNGYGATSGLV